jgi:voltage-gated potassium channel Kch
MKLLDSPRRRWYVLAVCWVGLMLLGLGGFIQQSKDSDLGRTMLDNLYLTLQLATLDYSSSATDLNWRLEIARFFAPLMAAGTLMQTASVVFRDQFTRWRIRFEKSHIIVCGLGAAGSRLAVALAAEGHSVVGIDADPTAPGLAQMREHEIPAIAGDATDPEMLQALRADRAARVVALCATDAVNVAVTAAVRQVERKANLPALRCSVHLTDAELTELLRGAELGGERSVRIEFFNLHERAARALLAEQPVFGDGSRPPHVVVMGLGQLGRSLVVAAAQQWAEVGEGPLAVTLVDREVSGRWQALRMQHPALADAVEVRCLGLDFEAPTAEAVDAFTSALASSPPTMVAVVFEDESLALSSALFVHKAVRDPSVPVVVRTDADAGLGGIVTPPGDATPTFPGMVLFPFLDRACSPSIIEGGVREQLARGMHEDHTARTGVGGGLHRPWEDLDDGERESSRRAADGTVDGLESLGYELVPLRRWGAVASPFSEGDIEQLAAREHERWKAEREAAGWSYGPERDNVAKRNPLLVAWPELSDADKQQNREGIRAMPAMLARAGFELTPR